LAGEGARVAVADLDSDAAHRVAHEIEGKALLDDLSEFDPANVRAHLGV
ncbi:MAG: hypothetical protein HKO76_05035, partial [Acidimicrobiia bacterium]|nr:hypothetical protein [Acidimicrobiia bacterium]